MGTIRKTYGTAIKAKVAIEAVKEVLTVGQIASKFQVHPTQVGIWKKQLISGAEALFSDTGQKERQQEQEKMRELYQQIGQLTVERDWLKKKVGLLEP